MTIEKLQEEILKMLPGSGISRHQKIMVSTLLYSFTFEQAQSVYNTLELEKKTLGDLARKEERVNLKYQMAMDKVMGGLDESSK